MKYTRIPRSFFVRDTRIVAQELLGKLLIRSWRGQDIIGRITEVESYSGLDDLASHASRGRTPRTEIMFGEAGHAYIYLIYGMYFCFNISTGDKDFPAAVLIRALEPIAGINFMQRARRQKNIFNLTTGPGKLTQALHITARLRGEDVTSSQRLYIADDGISISRKAIAASPRIGVDYAGASALLPWRYYLKHSQYISG
jgi:DNA-3-methyladenine glycosylase